MALPAIGVERVVDASGKPKDVVFGKVMDALGESEEPAVQSPCSLFYGTQVRNCCSYLSLFLSSNDVLTPIHVCLTHMHIFIYF